MNKKKEYKERPWLEFYDEEGLPANLEYPDCSMVDMIIQSAEKYPDNVAYSYYGHKVTFKNFVKKIEKTARALKNYGVKEGDRVTICMPNTPEGITMVYAVNMVGAVCNMVHPLSLNTTSRSPNRNTFLLSTQFLIKFIVSVTLWSVLSSFALPMVSAFLKRSFTIPFTLRKFASQQTTTASFYGKILSPTHCFIRGTITKSVTLPIQPSSCIPVGRPALRSLSSFQILTSTPSRFATRQ